MNYFIVVCWVAVQCIAAQRIVLHRRDFVHCVDFGLRSIDMWYHVERTRFKCDFEVASSKYFEEKRPSSLYKKNASS